MDGRTELDPTGSGAEPLGEGDPRRIGPIPLLGRLGAGGMGRVYLGVHQGRFAAVKQLLPSIAAEDKDFLRRFGQELDNLARLPERASARLLDGDRTAQPPWFATAWVPGLTLSQALAAHGGPLPAPALWRLLRETAAGLADVHALDMVHRDVKPSNVMLTLDGVTLIDFGVARAAEQSQVTRTGMVVGTPAYMSPEQASGARSSTGAVDVFALGSVLAYAGSGRPPFGDESGHGVLYRIVHEAPDLAALRALDAELADVVAACLDKDPDGRPTAADLVETAGRRIPPGPPSWPDAVSGPLAVRAAFAEHVPDAKDLPGPDTSAGPGADASAGSAPPADAERRPRAERRRRRKVLAIVIPVVVAGSTLSFQLLPYAFDRPGTNALPPSASASPSTTAPGDRAASPTASASAGPSASASAGADGRPGEKDGTEAGAPRADDGQGGGGPGDGSGGAVSSGASGGTAAPGGSGPSDAPTGGSDGSGGGSSSGGSSDGGSSAGSGGGGPAPSAFMLKNAENGKCVTYGAGNSPHDGACSGTAATWSFRTVSGGVFRIVNGREGDCMDANTLGHQVMSFSCGGGTDHQWRSGADGSIRSVRTGGCLDLSGLSGTNVVTETCDGSASQRWTRV